MKLIIGLGNPGEEYKKTRHNAGFLAVDKIADNFQFSIFNFQSIFNAEITNEIFENEKVILIKPQTFMNNSGQAVKAVLNYYKIDLKDIIIIHDDLDIPLGEYKISKNKNSGGHKGVQSVIDNLGTKDFTRVRIGVEIENRKIPTEKFVLEKFSKDEMGVVENVIEEICGEIVKLNPLVQSC
jgi:peptidyl-tRNA hydrolase, PTH1 family